MSSRCRFQYEVFDMNLEKNKQLIHHVYNESTHKSYENKHPLNLICDSLSSVYQIRVTSKIDKLDNHAKVILIFDDVEDLNAVKQVRKRFTSMTKYLLLAEIKEYS